MQINAMKGPQQLAKSVALISLSLNLPLNLQELDFMGRSGHTVSRRVHLLKNSACGLQTHVHGLRIQGHAFPICLHGFTHLFTFIFNVSSCDPKRAP